MANERLRQIREKQARGEQLSTMESDFLRFNENAPNMQTSSTQNVGGKEESNKTEGGTDRTPTGAVDRAKTSPEQLASPSQEDADKAKKELFSKTSEKDGVTTTVSAVDQNAAQQQEQTIGRLPAVQNLTQSAFGVPGNVDLTQGGTLSGDKSIREDRSLEDIHEELNQKSGPNPMPNREGNELTKATNFTAQNPQFMMNLDSQTSGIADELKEIRESASLSEEEKKKIQDIEKRLKNTGRVQKG